MPYDGTSFHLPTRQARRALRELTTLIEIRRLIARGWCQQKARMGDSYCLVGAVGRSSASHPILCYRVMRRLARALPASWNPSIFNLPVYNDNLYTTPRHVLAVIDRAIAGIDVR